VRLAPDHISTYCLTFEEDTALFVKLSQGRGAATWKRSSLLHRGVGEARGGRYAQYEVEFFPARPSMRHNLNTWRMEEWVGLGPSAASQFGGWRSSNVADLGQWLTDLDAGRLALVDRVELTPRVLAEDSLIFGLRMNEGVDLPGCVRVFPSAVENVSGLAGRLVEEDWEHGRGRTPAADAARPAAG